jgi:hypothetical protein
MSATPGKDLKQFKRIMLACGGVMVLGFGMMPFLVPSESDRRHEAAVEAQLKAELDKAQKDTEARLAEFRGMERDNARVARQGQSDAEPDVRKAWPDHPFSSDADAQKVYDRVRRITGN